MKNCIQIPEWIDDFIFNKLGAKFCPSYFNMTNIDDDREKTLNYLGTYFPRSYAEAYCIFSEFFEKYKSLYSGKTELKVFDFGCGTGGEIIGLLTAIEEKLPSVKQVRVVALDGNRDALLLYENIMDALKQRTQIKIRNCPVHLHINFYKFEILNQIMAEEFDVIISFKAICEFVTKKQFEERNAYEHITKFMLPKLTDNGIIVLADITTRDEYSQEWLPDMMDKGLQAVICSVIAKNENYNQVFYITHSHKQNEISKIAWRIIKR